jgi:broad specificity phosphatase PhoE
MMTATPSAASNAPATRAAQPAASDNVAKYVFLIRHAQSRWNVVMNAVKGFDLITFATSLGETGDVDHGLSEVGIGEVEELRERIQKEMDSSNGKLLVRTSESSGAPKRSLQDERFYAAFKQAKAWSILCSPMRRAVQTANRALPSEDGWSKIHLMKEAKELRNFTWELDCGSSPDNVGSAIAAGAELGKDTVRVDTQECESQWWNDAADTAEEQEQQLSALVERLVTAPGGSTILVTHSNVIRRLAELLSEKLAESDSKGRFLEVNPGREMPQALSNARVSKLRNCGVLGLRFRRFQSEWLVDDARLLFDSEFEER